jgi:arginine-glutamic acid dipeptide repeats protein
MEQHAKSERKSPETQKPQPTSFAPNEREDNKYPSEPPNILRHPYEPLLKFDPLVKYELPPHPINMDLKYLPHDHPARSYADSALKSQFSADNLLKGSSHFPSSHDMKYSSNLPPSSTANDSAHSVDGSRATPNQDSQGSNSNSQPATLSSPSIQSPLTSQPSQLSAGPPPTSGLFVSHPGLLSGHLPANHPSLLGSSISQLSASSLPTSSNSSPFLPISSGLHRPDPISSSGSRIFSTAGMTTTSSSLSSAGSAFGPGGSIYAASRMSENNRDGLPTHRTSPLGPLLHGSPHPLLSHPLPLHLGHPGIPGLPPHPGAHLPPHLHNHLMQPLGGPNTPLPLIGGPQPSTNALNSLIEAAGRRTPTSVPSSINHIPPSSSQHNSSVIQSPSAPSSLNSSSLSRTSPLVHPSPSGAFTHRPQSPSSNHPANLSRNSPLHLSGPSPAAISAERERHLMRQQSPHMTPPPPVSSSSSSLVASPLSKMYVNVYFFFVSYSSN